MPELTNPELIQIVRSLEWLAHAADKHGPVISFRADLGDDDLFRVEAIADRPDPDPRRRLVITIDPSGRIVGGHDEATA